MLYEKAELKKFWIAWGDDNLREIKYHSMKEKYSKKEKTKNYLLILLWTCLTDPSYSII